MDKYKKYFEEIEVFKLTSEILSDLDLQFEEINATKLKKILDYYLEQNIIQVMIYKRKKYFISTNCLNTNNLTIDEMFNKNNSTVNEFNNKPEYNIFVSDNALIEVPISRLFV